MPRYRRRMRFCIRSDKDSPLKSGGSRKGIEKNSKKSGGDQMKEEYRADVFTGDGSQPLHEVMWATSDEEAMSGFWRRLSGHPNMQTAVLIRCRDGKQIDTAPRTVECVKSEALRISREMADVEERARLLKEERWRLQRARFANQSACRHPQKMEDVQDETMYFCPDCGIRGRWPETRRYRKD